MTDEKHEEELERMEKAQGWEGPPPLSACAVGSAIAEGLGLDPNRVMSMELRIDAADPDNAARVTVEMLPTGLSTEQWREWAEALPVALVIENPYETKPLPPIPLRPPVQPTDTVPQANPPWYFLVVFFRWLGEFVRDRLSPLLLIVAAVGACGFFVGIGLGLDWLAVLASLVTSLAAICWVIMSLSGVFGQAEDNEPS